MVIKGRAGDNDRRKFVGRREGSRADGGTKEPQNYIRTESQHPPQGPLYFTKSSYFSHFLDEKSRLREADHTSDG